MLKHNKNKRLNLSKETLNKLTSGELEKAVGGATGLYSCRCPPGSDPCVTDRCVFTFTNC